MELLLEAFKTAWSWTMENASVYQSDFVGGYRVFSAQGPESRVDLAAGFILFADFRIFFVF